MLIIHAETLSFGFFAALWHNEGEMKNLKATALLLSTMIMLMGGALMAQAQSRLQFASAEDIAIAFYKTGGHVPNFEKWVTSREPYNLTPAARRPQMLENELVRLQSQYQNFNPRTDHLIIRSLVRLSPLHTPATAENPEDTYSMSIAFANAPEATYFPYDFMEERIIVMPVALDKHFNPSVSANEYRFLEENLRQSAENTLIMRLKPVRADLSQPHMIDGLPQWVMTADIDTLEVWSKQGRLLWEHTSPTYLSPTEAKIQNLYKQRPETTPEIGSIKPLEME